MPNIANALKAEISRLARKELRSETGSSKKAIVAYRHDIAELKRRMQSLEREVARLSHASTEVTYSPMESSAQNLRFRADGFAQHRKRLGLSAREIGILVGASPLSVYKWESGRTHPREKHLTAIAELRKMGKREAARRLAELQG